ncbi:MAG: hypothetical protein QHJ81_08760 [Anaerolineae bacterium]|nr:hypothetical protein [Anaerolineae bacterium]
MTEHQNRRGQFAICINTDDPDVLTPRMVYQVLPDESAERSNYVRVIDNEGEDYLYPADYFVFIDLPQATEQVLLYALPSLALVPR